NLVEKSTRTFLRVPPVVEDQPSQAFLTTASNPIFAQAFHTQSLITPIKQAMPHQRRRGPRLYGPPKATALRGYQGALMPGVVLPPRQPLPYHHHHQRPHISCPLGKVHAISLEEGISLDHVQGGNCSEGGNCEIFQKKELRAMVRQMGIKDISTRGALHATKHLRKGRQGMDKKARERGGEAIVKKADGKGNGGAAVALPAAPLPTPGLAAAPLGGAFDMGPLGAALPGGLGDDFGGLAAPGAAAAKSPGAGYNGLGDNYGGLDAYAKGAAKTPGAGYNAIGGDFDGLNPYGKGAAKPSGGYSKLGGDIGGLNAYGKGAAKSPGGGYAGLGGDYGGLNSYANGAAKNPGAGYSAIGGDFGKLNPRGKSAAKPPRGGYDMGSLGSVAGFGGKGADGLGGLDPCGANPAASPAASYDMGSPGGAKGLGGRGSKRARLDVYGGSLGLSPGGAGRAGKESMSSYYGGGGRTPLAGGYNAAAPGGYGVAAARDGKYGGASKLMADLDF
ncbi:MAG: hypothetical protein Q9222_004411, partial [Ikaeria aurantiellina]